MSGRHPAAFAQPDESSHALLQQLIDEGWLDSGKWYVVEGFADHDSANRGRLSINRGAKHMNIGAAATVSDPQDQCWSYTPDRKVVCRDPEAPHILCVRVFSKNSARAHIVQQTGGDPAKLRYNPWKKGVRKRGDDGS